MNWKNAFDESTKILAGISFMFFILAPLFLLGVCSTLKLGKYLFNLFGL
jgi:hypothetical protein